MQDKLQKLLAEVDNFYFKNIMVITEDTIHYIERLMPTCKDRGRLKWFAEIKSESDHKMNIDDGDLFPRAYFNTDCFIKEFESWLKYRNQNTLQIGTPEEPEK